MKIDNERVGKAVARLRTMRGLTQEQLNEQVGMKTIQHIEQGRNTPSLESLNKIAEALDVPAACIVLMGSKIDPADRVMTSLNSLLEASLSLELEQPQATKTDGKPQKKSGTRMIGKRVSKVRRRAAKDASKTASTKREKVTS